MRQLDQLSTHFPLLHETLLAMSAEPLGSEAISAIYKADQMYGPGGMPYSRLHKFLQSYLLQLSVVQRKQLADNPPVAKGYSRSAGGSERDRRAHPPSTQFNAPNRRPQIQTHAYEIDPRLGNRDNSDTTNQRAPIPRKYSKGSNPCWVCGSAGHSWFLCEHKKKGRCAACGSEAHMTKMCAQRYFAHPSQFASNNGDATQFTAKKASRCMHCDCPYEDCQEEEEIPDELETQEEEQPQTEVDLACASVQIVHAPPTTVDNTPGVSRLLHPRRRK